ncbi:hypothetical protein WUBG_15542 [Wuchereria bancrofti]|uniref:Uncharacterized protein n=1 Tax=Wuchereria bancrofti TaxID=6293 RepID=J9E9C6_WUCBA|nr:hypothetical protein WUBG_15542 [Wuchereria bancrofti]
MALVLSLIIGLLMIQTTNSQADKCDCENDYDSPFCDGIGNKENECYVGDDKQKLSPKGLHCANMLQVITF